MADLHIEARIESILDSEGEVIVVIKVSSLVTKTHITVLRSIDDFYNTLLVLNSEYGLLPDLRLDVKKARPSMMKQMLSPIRKLTEKEAVLTPAQRIDRTRFQKFLDAICDLGMNYKPIKTFLDIDLLIPAAKEEEEEEEEEEGEGEEGEGEEEEDNVLGERKVLAEEHVSMEKYCNEEPELKEVKERYWDKNNTNLVDTSEYDHKKLVQVFLMYAFAPALLLSFLAGIIHFVQNFRSALNFNFNFLANFYALVTWFGDSLCIFQAQFRIVFLLAVLYLFIHRILGYLAGAYLRSILGYTKENGKFFLEISWISLRCGLDKNEIVLSNVVWNNTSRFRNTPHFLHVKEIILTIDFESLYKCIMNKGTTAIKITNITLDGLELYVEREDKTGALNIWAALGAENPEEAKRVQKGISAKLAGAATSVAGGAVNALTGVGSALGKSAGFSGKIGSKGLKTLRSGAKSTGSLLNKTAGAFTRLGKKSRSTRPEASSVSSSSSSSSPSSSDGSPNREGDDALGLKDEEMTAEDTGGNNKLDDNDDSDDSDDDSDSDDANNDVASDSDNEENLRDLGGDSTDSNKSKEEEDDPAGNTHFGVPYLLEVDRITIVQLVLHASDYVTTKHRKASKMSDITIPVMMMWRKDLTKLPKRTGLSRTKNRRPIHLDDLVWRLLNRLISELLSNNYIAMMALLSHGTLCQTTSLVTDTVGSAANFTLEGIKGTGNVLAQGGRYTESFFRNSISSPKW